MACKLFGIECMVYMVKVSYHQKPYRRSMMQLWGANVIPSPSDQTDAGRAILDEDPDSPGSLGIAISEAVEDAVTHDGTKYALGSVLNHVLLHQTVIGQEAIVQMQTPRTTPTSSSAASAAAPTSPASPSPSCARSSRQDRDTPRRASSRPPARR